MIKYTQGPWEVHETDEGHEIRMGEAVHSPYNHETQCCINYNHMLYPEDGEQYEEAEANARLIAAAPDLLEAAEIGAKCLEIWLDSEECWCEDGCSCGKPERKKDLECIKQAISKAKGEIENN